MNVTDLLRNIDNAFDSFRPFSILFEVINDFGYACQLPLIRKLLEKNNVSVAITTSGLGDEPKARQLIHESGFDGYFIEPNVATWKKWSLVVCTDRCGIWYRRGHKTAYLQHGITGLGNYPYSTNMPVDSQQGSFDYFFASSETIKRLTHIYYPDLNDDVETFVVGYPRLDNELIKNKDANLAASSFDDSKQTVLFASHWNEQSLIKSLGAELLNRIDSLDRFNIVVSLHSFLLDMEEPLFSQAEDWLQKVTDACPSGRIKIVSAVDSGRYLGLVDYVIADHCSISAEACALSKPLFFYHNPDHTFRDEQLLGIICAASHEFGSVEQLMQLLTQPRDNIGAMAGFQERVSQYCFAALGTEAATNTTDKMMQICAGK